MSISYTIKGEAGKALDATARTFKQLRISQDSTRYATLDDDTFQFTCAADDSAGTGVIKPDQFQVIELYQNKGDGPVRVFRGHVTAITPGARAINVRVDGPWYWMRTIGLDGSFTPPFDPGGTPATRHAKNFPAQGLRTTVIALINKCIAVGVPMQLGTVDDMFAMIPINLPNMSCAAALQQVMRLCQDAVSWFDYSGDGDPVINITRRGNMTAKTFTVGTDRFENDRILIKPRTELKLSQTRLFYTDRANRTGKPVYKEQSAGTAVTGKIQFTTISGPERFDFLPKDTFENVKVKSQSGLPDVTQRDPNLLALKKKYGVDFPNGVYNWIDGYSETYAQPDGFRPPSKTGVPPLTMARVDGLKLSMTGRYYMTSAADLPPWAKKQLGAFQVQISGSYVGFVSGVTDFYGGLSTAFRNWYAGAPLKGFVYSSNVLTNTSNTYWFAVPFSFQIWVINHHYAAKTRIYNPKDYDYITPPDGLAAAWLACQNFTPWDGTFTLVENDLELENLVQNKIHIANTLSDCATMGAMVRGVTFEILRGRRTIDLGAPDRSTFGSAVNRVRQEPQGSFKYNAS